MNISCNISLLKTLGQINQLPFKEKQKILQNWKRVDVLAKFC